MRLCVLSEYFYPNLMGGTGTVLSELCHHLSQSHDDLEIEVITTTNMYRGEDLSLPLRETWDGVEILRVRSPKPERTRVVLRLIAGLHFTLAALLKMLSRPRHDFVLVVTGPPVVPIAALWYRRLRRVPYLYVIHDLYPDIPVCLGNLQGTSLLARLARRLQSSWLHHAHRVVVLGRCMKKYMTRVYGVPEDRLEVITNWSDPTILPLPAEQSRFRAERGLSGLVVLYSGNLGQCQDFDCILDAARLLREQAPDVMLCINGEGPKEEYIAQRIADEKLTNVRLFPMVAKEDFNDLLAAADVMLITLEPGMEGLGVPSKLYSSLAAGRPALAILAADSEVALVLEEAQCGLRVSPGDPVALADAIRQLRASEDLRKTMGRRAREVSQGHYTLAHVADQYFELFRRTIPPPH